MERGGEAGGARRRVCEVLDDGVGVLVHEGHGEPVEGLGSLGRHGVTGWAQSGYMGVGLQDMGMDVGLQVGCMVLQA